MFAGHLAWQLALLLPCLLSASLLCHPREVGKTGDDWQTKYLSAADSCTLPQSSPPGTEPRCGWRVASYGLAKWEVAATLLGHADAVCAAEFSAAGDGLVTGSADGTAVVWKLLAAEEASNASEVKNASAEVADLVVHGDASEAAGNESGPFEFRPGAPAFPGRAQREPERWEIEARLGRQGGTLVRDVSFAPDGITVLVADREGSGQIWGRRGSSTPDEEPAARDNATAGPGGGVATPKAEDALASDARGRDDAITFEGCYRESQFVIGTYYSNKAGVSFRQMVEQAVKDDRIYFAMSRHEVEFGHAYTILRTVGTPQYGTAACGTPCVDEPKRWCGCANEDSGGYPNSDCPSGLRLMAVYKLQPEFLMGATAAPLLDDVPRFVAAPPLWQLRSVLYGQGDRTWATQWPKEGTAKVAAGSSDRTACIWRGAAERHTRGSDLVPLVSCIASGSDGRIENGSPGRAHGTTVMTSTYPRSGSIWQNPGQSQVPEPWTLAAYLEEGNHMVTSAQWSFDGLRLLTGGNDGVARIWQLGGPDIHGSGRARWDVVTSIKAHNNAVWSIAWSPDSGRVMTGSKDGEMFVWRPVARKPSLWEEHVTLDALSGAQASDITGGGNATAEQSDIKGYAWEKLAVLNQKTNMDWVSKWSPATVAAWSPDGYSILTGSRDGSARIWQESAADVGQWMVVATLRGHVGALWTVNWSPDSRRVLTGSHDGSLRVWRLRGASRGTLAERAPEGNVASTRDTLSCQFVRYEGHTCADAGGALLDMVEGYEGTLEACRRQCCSMGEACAGFELVGGAAGAPDAGTTRDKDQEVDGAAWALARGRCFFRAAVLAEPIRFQLEPPRDCFKHVRISASEANLRHDHDWPHAHNHPL